MGLSLFRENNYSLMECTVYTDRRRRKNFVDAIFEFSTEEKLFNESNDVLDRQRRFSSSSHIEPLDESHTESMKRQARA